MTQIDSTSINLGRTKVDALDIAFDYGLRLAGAGRLDAYLRAAWEPSFRQSLAPAARKVERVGYVDGPLEWRGNAGLDWTRKRITVGVNGQFYGRYRIVRSAPLATDEQAVRAQGGLYVPKQFYVDLQGTYRFRRVGVGPEYSLLAAPLRRSGSVVPSTSRPA